jgi:uncharacterized protein YbjT (DUF2867 family)
MTVLVTGATGTVGGALVQLMTASVSAGQTGGAAVRAMVPTSEDADDMRGYDVEVVIGDLDRPETLDDALKGVESTFLVAPAGPDLAARELAFLDAVERAPDRPHVVTLAALGWEDPKSRFSAGHAQVVERLRSSGIRHTVLAPNGFMQDVLRFAAMVQEESALLLPVGDAAVSHVDARDVAAVAAHVLGEPAPHEGKAYDITGPAALTYAQIAAGISAVAGRTISYRDTPPDDVRQRLLGYGWSEWTVDGMLEVYAAYADGLGAPVTDEVEKATGRPATDFSHFLAGHAAAFHTV